ncbi:MAG: winged helix DNA-binding domain-containing protein [Actinomycetota bacterium]
MSERVLTLRELNRATLARQLLLQRKRSSPSGVIEHLVGMQAQSPQAPYLGIWSRAASFRPQTLERALERGQVVRATLLRQTIHLVTRRDYWLIRAALEETNHYDKSADAKRLAPEIRRLVEREPVTTAEALAYLKQKHGVTGVDARRAWRGARVRANVVHSSDSALWTTPREGYFGRYVALEEPEVFDSLEARVELARRYLAAFGPASAQDFRIWAMMRMAEVKPAFDRLTPILRFRDERGRELFDVPRAPLPGPETPAPVRFLPRWDNALLAFVDRARILPETYRKRVIRSNGDVAQTFLVDGFVAGTWSFEGGRVVTEPFAKLSASARRELREEAAGLEAILGA